MENTEGNAVRPKAEAEPEPVTEEQARVRLRDFLAVHGDKMAAIKSAAESVGMYAEASGRVKVWVTVVEVDGRLIAYGDGGANGNAGNPLVQYDRTRPADETRSANWAEELVTDVAGVARAAMVKIAKNEGDHVRF